MTNKEKILLALNDVELCDDCLSLKSGVTPRQTVFTICNQLFEASSIERHNGKCDYCHKAKKTSLISDSTPILVPPIGEILPVDVEPIHRPWYWEGNVQSRVVSHLVRNNSTIRSVADTASRISGKDIIAIDSQGKELWISVKGYPEKSSNVQARHWFSGAVFDLVLYHGENSNVRLGIALPEGFVTYNNLLPRIKWFKESLSFTVYWVAEDGNVREE